MRKTALLFVFIFQSYLFSQVDGLSVFLKVGRVAPLLQWKNGYQIAMGIEKELGSKIYALGIANYSTYTKLSQIYDDRLGDVQNSFIDIYCGAKWKPNIFYLMLALGMSNQKQSEVINPNAIFYNIEKIVLPAKDRTFITGLIGGGFELHIFNKFFFLSEIDFHYNEILVSSWSIGVKYSFY